MTGYSKVLIGTDGSEPAGIAVTVGAVIASKLQVPATIIAAYKTDITTGGSGGKTWAEVVTQTAEAELRGKGIEQISRVEREGAAGDVLIDVAGSDPSTLLIVGAQGLNSTTSRLTGSTSNHLSHAGTGDVLFAHKVPQQWGAIALATDGSATSKTAVVKGYGLAAALGASVFLVTAAKNESDGNRILEEVEQELKAQYPDYDGQRDILTGVGASEALVNASWKWDLLVIGNRGMSGLARVLGSTANSVTHESKTNLLMVHTSN